MTIETVAPPTNREPELLGQTVVLIGASAGIGLETARCARAEGAEVVLTGRDPERLKRAAGDLPQADTACIHRACPRPAWRPSHIPTPNATRRRALLVPELGGSGRWEWLWRSSHVGPVGEVCCENSSAAAISSSGKSV